MAGTIPLSMTQQFDVYGKPLKGGQLFIIQAGTVSTPQDAFQDTALTVKQPYPMTLDGAGRIPQFFLADGSVKVRLQDASGIVQLAADSVLVIGPSAGGGGGSVVDPTQLIQTGMMMFAHSTALVAGFVRLNGRTIGSATSGATERNNQDCQALFLFLWADPNLTVSGGRGANAAADWTANKTIALPDYRGRAIAGLDDMGNAAAGRLTAAFYGASATVLGQPGGGQSQVLTAAQLPSNITSRNTQQNISVLSSRFLVGTANATVLQDFNPQTAAGFRAPNSAASILQETSAGQNDITVTSNNTQNAPHGIVQPTLLTTFYMKL